MVVAISRIRRGELQQAAYEVLFAGSFHTITLEQVAARAGVAKSAVHHYFRNKRDLLGFAVRHGHAMYRLAVLQRLTGKTDPSARLWAIVDGNFAPEIFQPKLCRAWLSIFDASYDDENLRRLFEIVELRTLTNLCHELKQLSGTKHAHTIASELMRLIDGFWVLAASQEQVTRVRSLLFLFNHLRKHVSRFDSGVVRLEP